MSRRRSPGRLVVDQGTTIELADGVVTVEGTFAIVGDDSIAKGSYVGTLVRDGDGQLIVSQAVVAEEPMGDQ